MSDAFLRLDTSDLPSPCYVIDTARIEANVRALRAMGNAADAKVLLALKAFSNYAVADLIEPFLDGTAASGLWEARLGKTRFPGEVHAYVPGLKVDHVAEIQTYADHLIFNSLSQLKRFQSYVSSDTGIGLRINPRHRETAIATYDPCVPWSRLGVPASQLDGDDLNGVDGLHVHALSDSGYDAFDRLLTATEDRFSDALKQVEWINLGGGQLLTEDAYPTQKLVDRLVAFKQRWGLDLYLEPGTAVVFEAGALVCEVLDIGWNDGHFAILDASATCHMPDVIEAPYTPEIHGADIVDDPSEEDAKDPRVVRLGGPTCLAGDTIGTYRFTAPPEVGQTLIIRDQAYYTMVKSTTFNGTPLPAITLWDSVAGTLKVIKTFGYDDFEGRLV